MSGARLALALGLLGSFGWGLGCQFGVSGLGESPGELTDGAADAPMVIEDDDGGDVDGSWEVPDLFAVPDGIVPGGIGSRCAGAQACANGLCVDGYCCEEACDPALAANFCKACNLPGLEGHCALVPAGSDPRSQCAGDPQSTCAQDGKCDGKGACRKWGSGTPCGPSKCMNDTVFYPPACNGLGVCVMPGASSSCVPYKCVGAGCTTSCTGNGDCAVGYPCVNGSCGKRATGQPCTVDNDCQANYCTQGVCCNSPCNSLCFSCNLAGSQGFCVAVPAGLDPLDQCGPEDKSTCGQDGTCDGLGGCRRWPSGTMCAAPACQGDSKLSARTCNGLGNCQQATATTCGNYSCNPANGSCFAQPCTDSTQCAQAKMCKPQNGKCS
jgi:hypothetical protein